MRLRPGSTLFPYTTLFRSGFAERGGRVGAAIARIAARLPRTALLSASLGDERVLLARRVGVRDRKSTRLNSSHANISYAVFCLKKKIVREERNERALLIAT